MIYETNFSAAPWSPYVSFETVQKCIAFYCLVAEGYSAMKFQKWIPEISREWNSNEISWNLDQEIREISWYFNTTQQTAWTES